MVEVPFKRGSSQRPYVFTVAFYENLIIRNFELTLRSYKSATRPGADNGDSGGIGALFVAISVLYGI